MKIIEIFHWNRILGKSYKYSSFIEIYQIRITHLLRIAPNSLKFQSSST